MTEVAGRTAGGSTADPAVRIPSPPLWRHRETERGNASLARQSEADTALGQASAISMAIAGTVLFLIFLSTVAVVHTLERWMHARAADARLVQDFHKITADAVHATAGDLVSLAHQWQDANQQLAHQPPPRADDDSDRWLASARDTAAVAIARHALELLEQPAYLDVGEAVTLVVIVHRLEAMHALDGPVAPASVWVRQMLGRTVARGTQAILYLGRLTATAEELRQGASLATQLATVVPQDRVDDFESVATALTARAAMLDRAHDTASRSGDARHELPLGPSVDDHAPMDRPSPTALQPHPPGEPSVDAP